MGVKAWCLVAVRRLWEEIGGFDLQDEGVFRVLPPRPARCALSRYPRDESRRRNDHGTPHRANPSAARGEALPPLHWETLYEGGSKDKIKMRRRALLTSPGKGSQDPRAHILLSLLPLTRPSWPISRILHSPLARERLPASTSYATLCLDSHPGRLSPSCTLRIVFQGRLTPLGAP